MKKIILIIILIFLVYAIYLLTVDRKINYLYIGIKGKELNLKVDTYTSYIRDDDYRVIDLINDINDNIKIDNRTLQNLLIKSNIIAISIGNNDLNHKINLDYKYSDELINDLEQLLKLIRKYNKDKIYFIGYNNTNKYYIYINNKMKYICKLNKIEFIDNFTN